MSRAVAFLGLGVMGTSMARRLVEAGHAVSVYNRTSSRTASLVALGARQADTPQAAATGAEVVISMVTDGPDVEAVLLGEAGAANGAAPGATFVDMSTIPAETARSIAKRLSARGFSFLDAPVTGGDIGARDGTLSILVGGDGEILERVRAVLEVMGKRITHCGPVGAGQAVKSCNQILGALNLVGVVEALALARVSGVDPKVMVEALTPGAGGSWALEKLGPRIVRDDYAPGFMIDLMQKDLRIVQATAKEAGLPLEGAALAGRYFADNQDHGEGRLGTQAMFKAVLRRLKS